MSLGGLLTWTGAGSSLRAPATDDTGPGEVPGRGIRWSGSSRSTQLSVPHPHLHAAEGGQDVRRRTLVPFHIFDSPLEKLWVHLGDLLYSQCAPLAVPGTWLPPYL